LLHVSGFKPHEFTQQFVDANGNKFGHRAPWSDQTSRISRLFDFLTISNRMTGFAKAGRTPGKININTAWDRLSTDANYPGSVLFQALSDPQAANLSFYTGGADPSAQVKAIWDTLLTNRSQDTDTTSSGQTVYVPGPNSNPFWGLGMGYTSNTAPDTSAPDLITTNPRGINNTSYRSNNNTTGFDSGTLRLLEPSKDPSGNPIPVGGPPNLPAQPIQRFELLSKILGNVTTRSNVFGVWLTVGFFRVTDDTRQPVQLGAEYIWPSSQNVIRHKFFAIVDRSQLQVWPTYYNNNPNIPMVSATSQININSPSTSTTGPVSLTDWQGNTSTLAKPVTFSNIQPHTRRSWTLQAGAVLIYEPDTDYEETVVVDANGNVTFTVNSLPLRKDSTGQTYLHPAGCTVISRGNPGPWTQYDPAKDPTVVPYAARIN
jgi:hypothetical protein